MSRIEHFAIYATDTVALKDFYVSAFGLRVVLQSSGTPPSYFVADDGGMAIEIIRRPEGEAAVNQRWVCHLAFWVDDYASARAALAARGIAFEADTEVENESMRTAFFNDPEGNRCQIAWRRQPLGS